MSAAMRQERNMEKEKENGRSVRKRIIALLLVFVFVLGMYLSLRAQIRFSGLNYVGNVAEYAAKLTENNTGYLSEGTLERAWSILKTPVGWPPSWNGRAFRIAARSFPAWSTAPGPAPEQPRKGGSTGRWISGGSRAEEKRSILKRSILRLLGPCC